MNRALVTGLLGCMVGLLAGMFAGAHGKISPPAFPVGEDDGAYAMLDDLGNPAFLQERRIADGEWQYLAIAPRDSNGKQGPDWVSEDRLIADESARDTFGKAFLQRMQEMNIEPAAAVTLAPGETAEVTLERGE